MLTQHHSNMGLPKTFNRTQSKLDLDVHFILFIPFWGCWNSCSNHPLFMELWIYSLKFERAQSVKFLCPRMSPLYFILDGKAQINSSSLIIYRSQFSLAFSSSCWTKYKLKHYLPLKLPSTVATSQKYHSAKYGKSLSIYHAVLSAYAFKGKFHHIGDNLHLILISDRSSKTAIIDLSCFLPSNEIM